jgi:outer membrane receptor protein involved in Fe transport
MLKKNIMKQVLSVVMALLLFTVVAKAQQGGVEGKVSGDQQGALKAATISLLKAADSSLVKIALTNETGSYQFEKIAVGKYLLRISYVGYNTFETAVYEVGNTLLAIPAITLYKSSSSGAVATVTSRKPLIEQKAGKTVMNVENSVLAAGNSVLEVIQKAPGVVLDKDDNLSIKGRQGVIVLIDGKPQQLNATDLANLLRNMPAANIEQLEIITQASAKYDAAGNSGMINIKTKKLKKAGFNGTFNGTLAQGYYLRQNGGVNANYRKGKVNLFGNYNASNRPDAEVLELQREVDFNGKTVFDQYSFSPEKRRSQTGKFGIDYSPGKRTTLGVMVDGYNARNREPDNYSSTKIGRTYTQPDSSLEVITNSWEKVRNISMNAYFRHTFDSMGRELSGDFDRSFYKRDDDQFLDNFYYFGVDKNAERRVPWYLRNHSLSDIDITSAKLDYTHPLKNNAKIEAGLKYGKVVSDNDLQFDSLRNGNWQRDATRSNRFVYDENVNAAYLNFSKSFKKVDLMAGLRVEQTISEGNSVTLNQVVKRKYTQLFPSLFLSYNASEKHQFSFAYSRRVDRPNYQSLNPFIYFLDQYTFQQGNPFLKPSVSDNIEVSHTFSQFLTTSLGFQNIKDPSITVTEQNDTSKVTYAINRNLNSQRGYSLGINMGLPVTKWWETNNNIQLFYLGFKYTDAGNNLNAGQAAMQFNSNNSFVISKARGFTGEMNLSYQSPLRFGIFKVKSQTQLGFGFKKDILKKKASLKLSVDDVFNGGIERVATTYQNMNIRLRENGYNTTARLTFTYKFGKSDNNGRRRSGGAGDERGRLGIGGGSR